VGTPWRDKGKLLLEGAFDVRPTATVDLEGVYYWVTSGVTNLWHLYFVQNGAWSEIDFGSRFAALVHTHAYSPTGHNHDGVYSPVGHTHTIPTYGAKGHIALETLAGSVSPTGPGVWRSTFPKIEVEGTVLALTGIYVYCDAGAKPSSDLTFYLNLNGDELASVVLSKTTGDGSDEFTPEELVDGDEVSVDFPADMLGATGVRVYVTFERSVVA